LAPARPARSKTAKLGKYPRAAAGPDPVARLVTRRTGPVCRWCPGADDRAAGE
jgi:hypothetical protein